MAFEARSWHSMNKDVPPSVLVTLTEDELHRLESEAFIQCAIRGKLIYFERKAFEFCFYRFGLTLF